MIREIGREGKLPLSKTTQEQEMRLQTGSKDQELLARLDRIFEQNPEAVEVDLLQAIKADEKLAKLTQDQLVILLKKFTSNIETT